MEFNPNLTYILQSPLEIRTCRILSFADYNNNNNNNNNHFISPSSKPRLSCTLPRKIMYDYFKITYYFMDIFHVPHFSKQVHPSGQPLPS
jgi:hypothetical protein